MREVVQNKIRHAADGINVAADVNAVIATTTGKPGGEAAAVRSQSVHVVQKDGRTEVTEVTEES